MDHLANDRHVTQNTQRVALNALAFLYNKFLGLPLNELSFKFSRRPRYIPTVLSKREVSLVINELSGIHRLIAQMMYGSGLRVSECLRLRVQDVDFDAMSVTIHDGKGKKGRITILSHQVVNGLRNQVECALEIQSKDNAQGLGPSLPVALGRKYPNAFRMPQWMFIFPSVSLCNHPVTNKLCRHHLHTSIMRKAVKRAVAASHVRKRVTCHTFRHSFATHLLQDGTRPLQ